MFGAASISIHAWAVAGELVTLAVVEATEIVAQWVPGVAGMFAPTIDTDMLPAVVPDAGTDNQPEPLA